METNLNIDSSCLPPAIMLLALGGYYVCQGYKTILFFVELGRRGQSTMGRVIGLGEFSSNSHVSHIYPLISYQVNGKYYEAEAEMLLYNNVRVGQKISVRYLPENPTKITRRKTCLGGIGTLLLGLSLTVSGVWVLAEIGNLL